MADTGIFATTAEVQKKVGAGASTTANAEAYINQYMTEAESYINTVTRYNWSDAYAGLNVDVKGILKECASDLAAMYVIQYDMDGYGLAQAQTMLNFLHDRVDKCINLLKEKAHTDFIRSP